MTGFKGALSLDEAVTLLRSKPDACDIQVVALARRAGVEPDELLAAVDASKVQSLTGDDLLDLTILLAAAVNIARELDLSEVQLSATLGKLWSGDIS